MPIIKEILRNPAGCYGSFTLHGNGDRERWVVHTIQGQGWGQGTGMQTIGFHTHFPVPVPGPVPVPVPVSVQCE